MRLGLDFYDTITVAPRVYKKLAQSIIAGDGEVHIVTAVYPEHVKRVTAAVRRSHVPYTGLHIIEFTPNNYDKVPALKAYKAKELKLDMFIDDRLDTCQKMYDTRVLALRSLGESA